MDCFVVPKERLIAITADKEEKVVDLFKVHNDSRITPMRYSSDYTEVVPISETVKIVNGNLRSICRAIESHDA